MTIWLVLGILTVICIIVSFYLKGSTKIWRGLQVGAIIATITAIIMQHDALNSAISKKIIVVCVLVGGVIELRDRLNKREVIKNKTERIV